MEQVLANPTCKTCSMRLRYFACQTNESVIYIGKCKCTHGELPNYLKCYHCGRRNYDKDGLSCTMIFDDTHITFLTCSKKCNDATSKRFIGIASEQQSLKFACSSCQQLYDLSKRLTCGGCRKGYYCSKECQKKHWVNGHKKYCKAQLTRDRITKLISEQKREDCSKCMKRKIQVFHKASDQSFNSFSVCRCEKITFHDVGCFACGRETTIESNLKSILENNSEIAFLICSKDCAMKINEHIKIDSEDKFFCCTICKMTKPLFQRKLCGRCKGVYYCSRECQVIDWSNHKSVCQSLGGK